jgi:hypothetical protein
VIPEARPIKDFSIITPDAEELKAFVRLAAKCYPPHGMPPSFRFPGKIADMAACGEYKPLLAVDKAGHIGGGLVWHSEAHGLVEFFGPYVFDQPLKSQIAHALIDSCLRSVARKRFVGMVTRYPTPELPTDYFELLGSLSFQAEGGHIDEMPAYYRHLEEDLGLSVWAAPVLEEFLKSEYRRLFFAREIQMISDEGESPSAFSVLSARFNRSASRVTLQPVWWGRDAVETLAAHVDILLKEDIPNIFFEMDLGRSWQLHFTPALIQQGFEPRLVLPYAGKADLVVFQYRPGHADL